MRHGGLLAERGANWSDRPRSNPSIVLQSLSSSERHGRRNGQSVRSDERLRQEQLTACSALGKPPSMLMPTCRWLARERPSEPRRSLVPENPCRLLCKACEQMDFVLMIAEHDPSAVSRLKRREGLLPAETQFFTSFLHVIWHDQSLLVHGVP